MNATGGKDVAWTEAAKDTSLKASETMMKVSKSYKHSTGNSCM